VEIEKHRKTIREGKEIRERERARESKKEGGHDQSMTYAHMGKSQ
jgi:hypothetical protein